MEAILSRHTVLFDKKNSRIDLGTIGRRCIFCNRDYSDDLFSSEAHAISEFLNNRSIFHHNECDSCNDTFKSIERDFSSIIEIDKTILAMHGKNGVTQTNLSKEKSAPRICFNKKYKIPILNNAMPERNLISFDTKTGDIKIKNIRNSYYNTNVFKCLTKYALSIMPMELIDNYSILTKFVLQGTNSPYPIGHYSCENEISNNNTIEVVPVTCEFNGYMNIRKTYFLSTLPFKGLEVKLVNDENIDGLAIFSIFFGNTAFQIFIPNDDFFNRYASSFYNQTPINIPLPKFIAENFKHKPDSIEISDIDCRTHKKIEKEVDERHFSSFPVQVNKKNLSLDKKGDLVIGDLEIKHNISYDLISYWKFKLTLLWS